MRLQDDVVLRSHIMDKSPLRQGEGSSAASAPNTPPLWQAQKAKGERDMASSLCCVSRQGSGTKVPFNSSLSLPGIDITHTHIRRLGDLRLCISLRWSLLLTLTAFGKLPQAVQKPFMICVMLCVLGYLSIAWLGGGWSRLWSAPSKHLCPLHDLYLFCL